MTMHTGDMLYYYAVCGIISYYRENPHADFKTMCGDLGGSDHVKIGKSRRAA